MSAAQDEPNETPMDFASENQTVFRNEHNVFCKNLRCRTAVTERITITVIVSLGMFNIYTRRTVRVIRIDNDRRQY